MALILSIDTATEKAVVCIGNDEKILASAENTEQKTHAAFLQPAIENLLKKSHLHIKDLDAISVSNGPGSYTGLRVGLSSSKGIAYASQKPLILLNTLEVMAKNAALEKKDSSILYAPMIDARRMEVFAAIYNISLNNLFIPSAVILNEKSFEDILKDYKVLFFGSGAEKWQKIIDNQHAIFQYVNNSCQGLNNLAQQYFKEKRFSDLAYSEPFYLKSFYTK